MKFKQYQVRIDGCEGKFNAVVNHAEELGYGAKGLTFVEGRVFVKFLDSGIIGWAWSNVVSKDFIELSTEQFLELTKDDVTEKPKTITLYRYTYRSNSGVDQTHWTNATWEQICDYMQEGHRLIKEPETKEVEVEK